MITISARNAHQALPEVLHQLKTRGVRRDSRNGPVLVFPVPVCIGYEKPLERVVFCPERDANPFFHFFEALWMLAGRNDVEPLAYYAKQVREYSDDGKTFNGAYGYRWRDAEVGDSRDPGGKDCQVDQLDLIVNHLKADPNSRRAVLQMWNVEDDLLKIGCKSMNPRNPPQSEGEYMALVEGVKVHDPGSKDVCCNLSVMFSIRKECVTLPDYDDRSDGYYERCLDITVTNRSNDLVWGCLGANYVHFSFLQEYMAARLGVEVGRYHHFTNNLHVYDWNWKPEEWLADETPDFYTDFSLSEVDMPEEWVLQRWGKSLAKVPLIKDPVQFEKELIGFAEDFWGSPDRIEGRGQESHAPLTEPFLADVVLPMLLAFGHWKEHKNGDEALGHLKNVAADDWRIAGENWIRRRIERRNRNETMV